MNGRKARGLRRVFKMSKPVKRKFLSHEKLSRINLREREKKIGDGRAVARDDWWIQVETNERLDSDPTRWGKMKIVYAMETSLDASNWCSGGGEKRVSTGEEKRVSVWDVCVKWEKRERESDREKEEEGGPSCPWSRADWPRRVSEV